MGDSLLFDTNFQSLQTVLAAREKMQTIHAANIANADVPNYKADTRTFSDVFNSMNRQNFDESLARTNSRHMKGKIDAAMSAMDASKSGGHENMDGNTVDVQKETEGMAENQMMDDFTLRLLTGEIQDIQSVLKGAK